MITNTDIQLTLVALQQLPDLTEELPEFLYGHLSQCVLSAIYSLQMDGDVERAVVQRYTEWARLEPAYRSERLNFLTIGTQQPLGAFIRDVNDWGPDLFASDVLRNSRPIGGISRALSCLLFAQLCAKWEVKYFQDCDRILHNPAFEREAKKIRGWGGGRALDYFYMMVGDEESVKVDSRMEDFVQRTIGRKPPEADIKQLITTVAPLLQRTPRQIDNRIWYWERVQNRGSTHDDP